MIKVSPSRKAFVALNYGFLTLLAAAMLVPFLHVVAGSFSSGAAIGRGDVTVAPVEFNVRSYQAVVSDRAVWRAFAVSVYITIFGTGINLLMTSLMAYGLSKKELKGRSIIMLMILFTMIFQVPLVPYYLLVKMLGMLNKLWALLIPPAINAFNLIIMITFFQRIPEEILDQAKIDGCGEYRTLWRIVLPLSLASLATIGLFYAVAHWNAYFAALIFIRNPKIFPLQVKLRKLIIENDAQAMMIGADLSFQSVEGIKLASIIFTTIPILMVYPFLQKYFVKGALLGSLKG